MAVLRHFSLPVLHHGWTSPYLSLPHCGQPSMGHHLAHFISSVQPWQYHSQSINHLPRHVAVCSCLGRPRNYPQLDRTQTVPRDHCILFIWFSREWSISAAVFVYQSPIALTFFLYSFILHKTLKRSNHQSGRNRVGHFGTTHQSGRNQRSNVAVIELTNQTGRTGPLPTSTHQSNSLAPSDVVTRQSSRFTSRGCWSLLHQRARHARDSSWPCRCWLSTLQCSCFSPRSTISCCWQI